MGGAVLPGGLRRRSSFATTTLTIALCLLFLYALWPSHAQLPRSSPAAVTAPYTRPPSRGPKGPGYPDPRRPTHAPPAIPQCQPGDASFAYDYDTHARHHALSDDQCDAAFPHLFDVLDVTAAGRKDHPIRPQEILIDEGQCQVRALIYEAELFVVQGHQNEGCWEGQWHERTTSLLHSIHRAIAGVAPNSVPNVEFILNLDNDPQRPIDFKHGKGSNRTAVWGFTRQPNQTHIWLMPDYAHWAWPSARINSYGQVRRKMDETNAEWPWASKIPQAVWRGATHLNPDIRETLVNVTHDKEWADVHVCDIYDKKTKKYCLRQHEYCQYRFPIHTEGYTYSGLLKYLQLCESAPVIHELSWAEHHTHLLQPSGPEQNYIRVKPDWSDLEDRVQYYLDHDDKAATIASNSHETFARRYLTPAATSCYWRRLIRNWASVQGYQPRLYKEDPKTGEYVPRGISFEAYVINAEKPLALVD